MCPSFPSSAAECAHCHPVPTHEQSLSNQKTSPLFPAKHPPPHLSRRHAQEAARAQTASESAVEARIEAEAAAQRAQRDRAATQAALQALLELDGRLQATRDGAGATPRDATPTSGTEQSPLPREMKDALAAPSAPPAPTLPPLPTGSQADTPELLRVLCEVCLPA